MPHRIAAAAHFLARHALIFLGSAVALGSGVAAETFWRAGAAPDSYGPCLTGFAGVMLAVLPFFREWMKDRQLRRAHDEQVVLLRLELDRAKRLEGEKIVALRAELDRVLQQKEWLKGVIERHIQPALKRMEPALQANTRRLDDLEASLGGDSGTFRTTRTPDPDRPPPPNAKDSG